MFEREQSPLADASSELLGRLDQLAMAHPTAAPLDPRIASRLRRRRLARTLPWIVPSAAVLMLATVWLGGAWQPSPAPIQPIALDRPTQPIAADGSLTVGSSRRLLAAEDPLPDPPPRSPGPPRPVTASSAPPTLRAGSVRSAEDIVSLLSRR